MSDATNPVTEAIGQPEIILLLRAEGGSLSLKRACRRAYPDAKGEQEHAGVEDAVFWIERDERTLEDFCSEEDLPDPLFARSETRSCFADALKDLLDAYPWWHLSPLHVDPAWVPCFREVFDLRFPGWMEDPEPYSREWYAIHAWRKALQVHPSARGRVDHASTHKRARQPRRESS